MARRYKVTLTYNRDKRLRIKDIGHFYRELVSGKISVGIHKSAGSTNLKKAMQNEFGSMKMITGKPLRVKRADGKYHTFKVGSLIRTPARPFIRLYIYPDKIEKLRHLIRNEINAKFNYLDMRKPRVSARLIKEHIGLEAQNQMKDIILSNDRLQPNAPLTQEIKGFDYPLVRTGRMVSAISFKVSKKR